MTESATMDIVSSCDGPGALQTAPSLVAVVLPQPEPTISLQVLGLSPCPTDDKHPPPLGKVAALCFVGSPVNECTLLSCLSSPQPKLETAAKLSAEPWLLDNIVHLVRVHLATPSACDTFISQTLKDLSSKPETADSK